MFLDKSLSELTVDDIHLSDENGKYKVDIRPDSTVGSLIYEHLVSKPGFIRHKRSGGQNDKQKNVYLKAIHNIVAKGAPLEIFISAFSPKITNPAITNGHIYPDMADLLSLIHLHSVAKGIREIYDYGFRFIVGYRGGTYQRFFNWSDEEVALCFKRLNQLKDVAEQIVGVRNVVRFVDIQELIEEEGEYIHMAISDEIEKITKKYEEGDAFYLRKINAWMRDFKQAIDPKSFKNEEEMNDFLLENALHFRAVKDVVYTGGKHNLGICNSFPNVLLATIRGLEEKISIQINPFFRFHSHQRLIALRTDGNWETMKWTEMEQIESTFEPVYIQDFDYPFYFLEK